MSCVSMGCDRPTAKAIYLGMDWPDGRPRYTLACAEHVAKVVDYQASNGVRALVLELDQVTIVGRCAAAWRSHGCYLPDDHEGKHVCMPEDCGDSPRDDDDVFHIVLFNPCDRTGGVKR